MDYCKDLTVNEKINIANDIWSSVPAQCPVPMLLKWETENETKKQTNKT